MNDSSKVWLPKGVPSGTEMLLSVPDPGRPMSAGLYRSMLAAKLAELIQADPKAALRALEMSQEEAPELWAIAQQYPIEQWAIALVRSDQMTRLLAGIDGTGHLSAPKPVSLLEILELLA